MCANFGTGTPAMKAGRAIVLSAAAVLVVSLAKSGHELPVYPSYYPHEIEIAAVALSRRTLRPSLNSISTNNPDKGSSSQLGKHASLHTACLLVQPHSGSSHGKPSPQGNRAAHCSW